MRTCIATLLILLLSAPVAHAHYYDGETGLDQNYFRDYDTGSGRYIEADPIGLKGEDINLYRYVENNPVMFTDFWGLRIDWGNYVIHV